MQALDGPAIKAMGKAHPQFKEIHKNVYDSFKKLQGLDDTSTKLGDRERKGFLKTVMGTSTKNGYFQQKIMSRVQDVVGRSTASMDPTYNIDQLGIPEGMAWTFYGPFVVGKLTRSGMGIEQATKAIKDRNQVAKRMLDEEMKQRPLIVNRAPSLHKFNMMAFKPHIIQGKAIKVSPLVTKGFNLDFDGDATNIHVPISQEGVTNANNMLPSMNVFNPLNKNPMHVPSQETIVGAYMLTHSTSPVVKKTFRTKAEALAAYHKGEIGLRDKVTIQELN
jgi:DNA-directed RNA polymerase subunit beta'